MSYNSVSDSSHSHRLKKRELVRNKIATEPESQQQKKKKEKPLSLVNLQCFGYDIIAVDKNNESETQNTKKEIMSLER